MTFELEVTRTWYRILSDEVESWQTDPHRIEPSTMEYDDDAQEEYATPVEWAVAMLSNENIVATPGMSGFPALEPSASPIGDAAQPHDWLSGHTPDNYTNEECETTIRLTSDGWTPEQRADVFRGATA